MIEGKTERLHVTLTPEELADLDGYQSEARILSRSKVIRQLIKISLKKDITPEHLSNIKILQTKNRAKIKGQTERVHIALKPSELAEIDLYYANSDFESRCDAVRYLLTIALKGVLPERHLRALEGMDTAGSSAGSDGYLTPPTKPPGKPRTTHTQPTIR